MYLNCHTYFSLHYGTLSPGQLVEAAAAMGIDSLALTDINNTSAVFDFIAACRKHQIHPVVGLEFRNGSETLYIALARNNAGFEQINRFFSGYKHRNEAFPNRMPPGKDIHVIYPAGSRDPATLQDHEWLGIRPAHLPRLYRNEQKQYLHRYVVWQPVTFSGKKGYNLHRLLRAIDENTLLSKLKKEQHADAAEELISPDELAAAFRSFPRIVAGSLALLDDCSIDFTFNESKNRKSFTGSRADDRQLLKKLAMDGANYRYGHNQQEALKRIHHELDIIDRMHYSAYYLITWDLVRYAQSRGFFHVGRGSGANSIIAYCLGITDVDPVELDLYFERFLNIYRDSPPDFDIDFSWRDRDEVIDYFFKRYGQEHTALLAAYNTFQGKSIIRELGKVFGLPKSEIDDMVRHPESTRKRDHIGRLIFNYGKMMEDFPNHLSVHAGGILVSEKPIYCYTSTEIPPKGFPITHFDMYVAEDIGFYKYDILSQRGLGHIRDAVKLISRNQNSDVDIHRVADFKKDPKLNELLAKGDTIGCFYIESPAMRQLLSKLHCHDYLTLVAASSIIRPGVARSGMMREYIHHFHHPDDFEYAHPKLKDLLEETYGVMVYQEDVIKVAHHFAGLSLAEADVLRRGISGKKRSREQMVQIKKRFFDNCHERGYAETLITEVWRQIESFAAYSFSKAHSASYAVESYQSLFLKAYYPLEFMVAVINNFGGFYNTEFYAREAQRSGGVLHPPCVNHSEYKSTIYGRDIYLGFVHLDSLEQRIAQAIEPERQARGNFINLEDFIERIPASTEQLNLLIRSGAFRFTEKSKKTLLWEAQLLKRTPVVVSTPNLFRIATREYQLPVLAQSPLEDAFDEVELLGFPVGSPYSLLRKIPENTIPAGQMMKHLGQRIRMLGSLAAIKYVRTIKHDLMQFASFRDPQLSPFDTVHFPDVAKRYPFSGAGFYLLEGKVVEEFGVAQLEVQKMKKMPQKADPRAG